MKSCAGSATVAGASGVAGAAAVVGAVTASLLSGSPPQPCNNSVKPASEASKGIRANGRTNVCWRWLMPDGYAFESSTGRATGSSLDTDGRQLEAHRYQRDADNDYGKREQVVQRQLDAAPEALEKTVFRQHQWGNRLEKSHEGKQH